MLATIQPNIQKECVNNESQNNLAVVRAAQGDDKQAAELYVRALAIFEAELGADHPTVVTCRENYEDRLG